MLALFYIINIHYFGDFYHQSCEVIIIFPILWMNVWTLDEIKQFIQSYKARKSKPGIKTTILYTLIVFCHLLCLWNNSKEHIVFLDYIHIFKVSFQLQLEQKNSLTLHIREKCLTVKNLISPSIAWKNIFWDSVDIVGIILVTNKVMRFFCLMINNSRCGKIALFSVGIIPYALNFNSTYVNHWVFAVLL